MTSRLSHGTPILLAGGRLFDPVANIDEVADLAIADGRIVATRAPQQFAGERIDVSGKLVVPGLIDGHAHCYGGIGPFHPDDIGVSVGVTTVVDAASAGSATFEDALVATQGELTDVYHILYTHPDGIGTPISTRRRAGTADGRQLNMLDSVPIGEILRLAEEYPDRIRAIKTAAFPDRGPEWVRVIKQVASWANVPAYFHMGNFGHPTEAALGMGRHFRELEAGDIVTHVYTDATGGILDADGVLEPEALRAAERGVYFDLGFGTTGFSFKVAESARKQGMDVVSLSTDWQDASPRKRGYDLVGLMGLVSCLGFDLDAIVPMVTSTPARMFGFDELGYGTLRVGTPADVTILDVHRGEFEYRDLLRETRVGPLRFEVVLTVKSGQVITPDPDAPYSSDNRRYRLCEDPELLASRLDSRFRETLLDIAVLLETVHDWDPEALHRAVHALFQQHGLSVGEGLAAVYGCFMTRTDGPQLGWWLAARQRERGSDVASRIRDVTDLL